MPYDYTRLQVGDKVRDNQTLQEAQVIDLRMVGQWSVVVTLLYITSGIRKDVYGVLKSAPRGTPTPTPQELAAQGSRPAALGEAVEVVFDSTSPGARLKKIASASLAESAAAQNTASTVSHAADYTSAEPGLSKLSRFIEKDDLLKHDDKDAFLTIVRKLQEKERSQGVKGFVSGRIAHIINTPGASTVGNYEEIERYIASIVPDANNGTIRRLASYIRVYERNGGLLSAGEFRTKVIRSPFFNPTADRQLGYQESLHARGINNLLDRVRKSSGSETEYFLDRYIGMAGTDSLREKFFPAVKASLTDARENLSRARALERTLNDFQRLWPAMRARRQDDVVAGAKLAMDNARWFGLASKDESQFIIDSISAAFSTGRGVYFYDVQKRMRAMLSGFRGQGQMWGIQSRLESAYTVYDLLQRRLFDLSESGGLDSDLSVMDMSASGYERNMAAEFFAGLRRGNTMLVEDDATEAHARALLGLRGANAKMARQLAQMQNVNTAIAEAKKSIDFGETLHRDWHGMRLDITGVVPDAQTGGIRVVASPSAGRVLNDGQFYLMTNIDAGEDPLTALRSRLTAHFRSELLASDVGSPLLSTGQVVDIDRDAKRAGRLLKTSRGFNIEGATTMDQVLSRAYEGAKDPGKAFTREVRAALGRHLDTNEIDERLGRAYEAYADSLLSHSGSSVKNAHMAAIADAIAAASGSINGPRMVSIDTQLPEDAKAAEAGTRVSSLSGFSDPEFEFTKHTASVDAKRKLLLTDQLGMHPRLAAAIVDDDIDAIKKLLAPALAKTDPTRAAAILDATEVSSLLPILARGRKKWRTLTSLITDAEFAESMFASYVEKRADQIASRAAAQLTASLEFMAIPNTLGERLTPAERSALNAVAGGGAALNNSNTVAMRLSGGQVDSLLTTSGDTTDPLIKAVLDAGVVAMRSYSIDGVSGTGAGLLFEKQGLSSPYVFTAAGGGDLVDALGQRFVRHEATYNLPADVLLNKYGRNSIGRSQLELEDLLANHLVGSKMYALPQTGLAWQPQFISTFESQDVFRRHIQGMRDLVEGRVKTAYIEAIAIDEILRLFSTQNRDERLPSIEQWAGFTVNSHSKTRFSAYWL